MSDTVRVPREPTEEMMGNGELAMLELQHPAVRDFASSPQGRSIVGAIYRAMVSAVPQSSDGWIPVLEELDRAIESAEAALKKEQEVARNFRQMEDYIFGTETMSFEEFALKELACWNLIDEVEALRRGIGFTHVGVDPIVYLREKWKGLLDRAQLVKDLEMVRESRQRELDGKGE